MQITWLPPVQKAATPAIFYLDSLPNCHNDHKTPHNVAVHTGCCLLKKIVCFAAEAKCGGLYNNAQVVMGIFCTLESIGHKQNPRCIKTDNKTTNLFVHNSMLLIQRCRIYMRASTLADVFSVDGEALKESSMAGIPFESDLDWPNQP